MPTPNHPIEPSAFRELQRRVERLEAENHRLSGRKLLTVDRFATADLPGPTEGQVAIETADDTFKYYANSAWRTPGSSADAMWPMGVDLYQPADFNSATGKSPSDWTEVADIGTTVYGSTYITNTTGGATDGDYLTRIVRLGPQGSIWNLFFVTDMGTDYGKTKVQIASIGEDTTAAVAGFSNVTGAMESPDDGDSITWYDLTAFLGTSHDDHYSVAPATGFTWENGWQFRIMGAPGTELTATPTYDSDDQTYHVNGGPGLYGLRWIVDGKNASSSGYRVVLRAWRLYRLSWHLLNQ